MCSLLHQWLNYFLFAVTMGSLELRKAVALNVTLQHFTVDFKELNIHGGSSSHSDTLGLSWSSSQVLLPNVEQKNAFRPKSRLPC